MYVLYVHTRKSAAVEPIILLSKVIEQLLLFPGVAYQATRHIGLLAIITYYAYKTALKCRHLGGLLLLVGLS